MNKINKHWSIQPPKLPPPLVVAGTAATRSLNAVIVRLSEQGLHREVLFTFNSMLKSTAATPDSFTYPSVLKACTSLGFFRLGLSLHQTIVVSGFASDSYILSSLISFYARLKNPKCARSVFDMMPQRNIVPWTAIIQCYSHAGDVGKAFLMYNSMQYEGISPTSIVILNMLSGVSASTHVEILHSCVIKFGFTSDTVLTNCLMSVYAKSGRVDAARDLFDLLDAKDVVSWNSLINAYSILGNLNEVLRLVCKMRSENIEPDQQTFVSLIKALARENCLGMGRVVHGQVVTYGFGLDKHVGTSLLNLYSRCNLVEDALQIFESAADRDTVYWTAMISGLEQNESADKALIVFRRMLVSQVMPSAATFACVLAACAQLGSIKLGTAIQCYMLRRLVAVDLAAQNSLVTMYAKCGKLVQSFAVFSMMEERDLVSWNAMVAGYAQNGYLDKSFGLFHEMRLAQQQPDSITVVSLLQACASIGAYHQGKWIHNYIFRSYMGPCIRIGTSLVDMYAKCGDLRSARTCFDRMPEHDTVSWSTIIAGYGSHGKGETALEMYYHFLQSGLTPNEVVFLSVLYACSHNGLIEKGMALFESMKIEHGIEPKIEHCACVIDLLCRAGRVEEAYNFYKKVLNKPTADVLGILLDACRSYSQEELGFIIAQEISHFEPEDAGKYVQLAHNFAATAKWDGVGKAWIQMRSLGLRKLPGWSLIEMHGILTPFFTSHSSHPEYSNIVAILRCLTDDIKKVELISSEDEDFAFMFSESSSSLMGW